MYKVTGIYPATVDGWFDFDYYEKHMRMCMDRFGPGAKRFEITRVISTELDPGPPKYVCIGTMYVESMEVFYTAMASHLAEISADVKNYTNIQPDIVVEQVVVTADTTSA